MKKYEKEYEEETGQEPLIAVIGHGEKAYASWEYQQWLEKKIKELEQRLKAGQHETIVMPDNVVKEFHVEESKFNEGLMILVATTHGGKKYVVGGDHHNHTYLKPYDKSYDTGA